MSPVAAGVDLCERAGEHLDRLVPAVEQPQRAPGLDERRGRSGEQGRAEVGRLGEPPCIDGLARIDADADRCASHQSDGGLDRPAGPLEAREVRAVLRLERLASVVDERAGDMSADVVAREHRQVCRRSCAQFSALFWHCRPGSG
jgi:hypothetical protein